MAARTRIPKVMTEGIATRLHEALLFDDDCEPARQFLKMRKLWDNVDVLVRLEIGAVGDTLTFPQRDANGRLQEKYRWYKTTAVPSRRWGWSVGEGVAMLLWPWLNAPQGTRIWIVEGEWDALTLISRLESWGSDLWAYTWTCGAAASVLPVAVPEWLHGREVNLCYDNDVYQGPDWKASWAPTEKDRAALMSRRKKLIEHGHALESLGCKVLLRAVPVEARRKWGGDIRDWVDAGGRDLESIPASTLAEVQFLADEIVDADRVSKVAESAGRKVVFSARVNTVEEDSVTLPLEVELECEMGTKPCCNECRGPLVAPNKLIDLSEHQEVVAESMFRKDAEEYLLRKLVGRPSKCSYARLRTTRYEVTNRWGAFSVAEEHGHEVAVISKEVPNLSGETEVQGVAHHAGKGIVVIAQRTRTIDVALPDLNGQLDTVVALAPPARPTAEQIDEHVRRRADHLAAVATDNRGRERVHVLTDLLYHSVLWMMVEGKPRRGWLDVAVVGDTRSGKSSTAARIAEWLGLGTVCGCGDNISRAGLTTGAVKDNSGRFRLRPGLLPRLHARLLVLDEFHIMVEESRSEKSPMLHLQTARSDGIVEGVKVYGARRLNAAVRLMTISNWLGGRSDTYRFPCQHFGDLYGRPEMLARLDIGVVVQGEPETMELPPRGEWTRDMWRWGVLRAWTMKAEDVVIEPEALLHARCVVEAWRDLYEDQLPLFTYAEKPLSLLRIATAVSCMCITHPGLDLSKALVTKEHVEWARLWLECVWDECGYEAYSISVQRARHIDRPLTVERMLTADLGLLDAADACRHLARFFQPMGKYEVAHVVGMPQIECDKWVKGMMQLGALEHVRERRGGGAELRVTVGCARLLRELLRIAADEPERYAERVRKLQAWPMKDKEPTNMEAISV